MSQLKFEAESIQVSIYCEIIIKILEKHFELSVNKVLFFAYLIKKDRFIPGNIYNGNNSQDIINKCISFLAGDFFEYCNSLEFIIKSIHILKENGRISLENDILRILPEISTSKTIYKESMFIEKAIEVSKRMTDRQFMKEVTKNV